MKVIVQGAGAVGAYIGARLAEAGHEVTFFVRSGRRQQLKEHGLMLYSTAGDFHISKVNTITSSEEAESADLIIWAVKGYHIEEALPQLADLAEKTGAAVLPLLNGTSHIDKMKQMIPDSRIIGGLAFIIAALDEKGHVHHTSSQHGIIYGALLPEQEAEVDKIEELFEDVNAETKRSRNVWHDMWKKYMFITAFSGITTAADLTIGPVVRSEEACMTIRSVLMEMKDIANTENGDITSEHAETALKQMKSLNAEATSSMHNDLLRGGEIEVEHLQGEALKIAEKHSKAAPVLFTMYSIIKPKALNR
ncbi:ketopantoate reductase family protein [Sinobaca sp. H24]|uniref:ketopantoate reductase family protein n=1 Tax=Sinobaca sp. H24 TaxID=2923376 RepID=UPI00207A6784|nr:2-dehydropantoate 2-reductase [Sinobaca sp. H24]